MKTIGVVLAILGVLALAYGGIDYNRESTLLEIGSVEVVTSENRELPIPAVVGAVVLLGGIGFLVAGNRRNSLHT
jgi:hypothetical protein